MRVVGALALVVALSGVVMFAPGRAPAATSAALGAWEEEVPTLPEGAAAIHDSARDRMILVGGDGVWALGLSPPYDWSRLATSGPAPPNSVHQCAVYDPPRDRIIVFGIGGAAPDNYVTVHSLSLAGLSWSLLSPTGPVPLNWWHPSATYDPLRQRVLLIGGGGHAFFQYSNEVWSLSLSGAPAWTLLTPAGTPPPGRAFHVAAYDPLRDRILVQGGVDGLYRYGRFDLWQLRLGVTPTWEEIHVDNSLPSGRYLHTGVYDVKRDRMILFAGLNGGPKNADVWTFVPSPTPRWEQVLPLGTIGGRSWHSAILDTTHDAMVVFGGRGPQTYPYYHDAVALHLTETPEWVGVAPLPASRIAAATALDTRRGRLMVFGGFDGDGTFLADLWAYDLRAGNRWTRIETPATPPPRMHARMVYDAAFDRLALFGGYDGSRSLGDTWTLPLESPDWKQLPGGGPPPRHGHTLVVDAARGRALVFGGGTAGGCCVPTLLNDVWALTLDTEPAWSPLSPEGDPPAPRFFHAGAFDDFGARLIVHGGAARDSLRDDLWELRMDGTGWREIPRVDEVTPGVRNGRYGQALEYDRASQRMLLFGGADSTTAFDDTWELDLAPDAGWRRVTTIGRAPEPRYFAGSGFDEATGRLVAFGAAGPGNDIWAVALSEPVAAEVSLVSASVKDGIARLSWYLVSGPRPGLRVERRTQDSDWSVLASVTVDGAGRAAYEDRGLAAGMRYGYRLVWGIPADVSWGPETWIEVPSEASFALAGAFPNPASAARLMVAFSLPSAQPARLELFDLAGRRVAMHELHALGVGSHLVRLDPRAAIAPGVYWLSLTQGARCARARVAVFD